MQRWMILLGVALLTGGCVGFLDGDEFVTATEHWKGAEDEAGERLEDPALIGVAGLEISDIATFRAEIDEDEEEAEDPEDRREAAIARSLARYNDTSIGDGLAQAWYYEFVDRADDPDDATFFGIVVDADGDVLFTETAQEPILAGGGLIEDWRVDSDEAVSVARDNHPLFANLTDEDHVSMVLIGTAYAEMETSTDEQEHDDEDGESEEAEDPFWWLSAETADGNASTVLVNATTGEYMGEFSFDFDYDYDYDFNWSWDMGPPQESGRFQDQLTLTNPSAEHSWQIAHEGHEELRVTVSGDIPAGTVLNVTVTGPDERTRSFAVSGGSGSTSFSEPIVGPYDASVTLDEGAAQRYTLDWCAPGVSYGPPGTGASGCWS